MSVRFKVSRPWCCWLWVQGVQAYLLGCELESSESVGSSLSQQRALSAVLMAAPTRDVGIVRAGGSSFRGIAHRAIGGFEDFARLDTRLALLSGSSIKPAISEAAKQTRWQVFDLYEAQVMSCTHLLN